MWHGWGSFHNRFSLSGTDDLALMAKRFEEGEILAQFTRKKNTDGLPQVWTDLLISMIFCQLY